MCIRDRFSRPIVFGEDRLREKGSSPATFFVLTRVFSMANDNCRKFKHNQIIFCMQLWIVDFSRPIVFGIDRLTERGSLPATFYVVTREIFTSSGYLTQASPRLQVLYWLHTFVRCTSSGVWDTTELANYRGEEAVRARVASQRKSSSHLLLIIFL